MPQQLFTSDSLVFDNSVTKDHTVTRDYAVTVLGPIEGWPEQLRIVAEVTLSNGLPAVVLWGPEPVWVYNDEFRKLIEANHSTALGQPAGSTWPEIWDASSPTYDRVRAGETLIVRDKLIPLHRGDACEDAWFTLCYSPLRSSDGLNTGVLITVVEVTARLRAEAALRESQTRAHDLVNGIALAFWEADPNGAIVTDSPSWCAFTGQTTAEWMSTGWLNAIHPADRERTLRLWHEANEARRPVSAEYRLRVAAGGWRWVNVRAAPVLDEDGKIRKWVGMNIDVHDRKQAEEKLRNSEDWLRTLMEGVPQLNWRAGPDGRWTWASPQWLDYTGQTQAETHGLGWLDVVHPADRDAAVQAWDEAQMTGRLDVEFRVRRAIDGAWRWFQTRSLPARHAAHPGAEDRAPDWLGTSTDINDLKVLQSEQGVLVKELQHRSRNLLSVVRSVARRSIPASPGRDEYDARLAAIGRVQGFLARTTAYTVLLHDLVVAELEATGHGSSSRIMVDGPPVVLLGEGAQPFVLALHELATNAVKYGALSEANPAALLSITWRIREVEGASSRLLLLWRESGVAMPVGPPGRQGYGSELITRALPYQLKAETSLEFTPDGVHCQVNLPAGAFSHKNKDTAIPET